MFKYRLVNSRLINSTFLHNKEGCLLDFSDENNAYMIYFVSFLGTLAVLPGNIVSALLMDKIGRLRMLAGSSVISCVSCFFLSFGNSESAMIALLCLFGGISIASWNALDVLTVELYPSNKRTTAFGFLNALCKLAAVLGISIFQSFVGITKAVPILFASGALAAGSFLALKLPETRGQTITGGISGWASCANPVCGQQAAVSSSLFVHRESDSEEEPDRFALRKEDAVLSCDACPSCFAFVPSSLNACLGLEGYPIFGQPKWSPALYRPVEASIRRKLTQALQPEHLEVLNESPHSMPSPPGSESHFTGAGGQPPVRGPISAAASPYVQRGPARGAKLQCSCSCHAGCHKDTHPTAWSSDPSLAKSPPCLGGSKHDSTMAEKAEDWIELMPRMFTVCCSKELWSVLAGFSRFIVVDE
ncbi:hypothetical protein NFI96_024978 [Prochilodus magdalenae]|nr:hypothetical protein NFI96_024978 [Prochilodus magdalenae]